MPDDLAVTSADSEVKDVTLADINITAHGDRRALEMLYLELREMAKQKGLQIEYELNLNKPPDQAKS